MGAVQEAIGQAVRDAVQAAVTEVLTNPALQQRLRPTPAETPKPPTTGPSHGPDRSPGIQLVGRQGEGRLQHGRRGCVPGVQEDRRVRCSLPAVPPARWSGTRTRRRSRWCVAAGAGPSACSAWQIGSGEPPGSPWRLAWLLPSAATWPDRPWQQRSAGRTRAAVTLAAMVLVPMRRRLAAWRRYLMATARLSHPAGGRHCWGNGYAAGPGRSTSR